MTSKIVYTGQLGTEMTHVKSGAVVKTDAPTDNNGLGQAFSPTDLLASSLASCMLTIMGIKARDKGIDIVDASAELIKEMASNPRRVAKISIKIQMPNKAYSDKDKKLLLKAAEACPVFNSLHPSIETDVKFYWQS